MARTEQQAAGPRVQEPLAHVPALDGIRGLAILLVLVFHLLWYNTRSGSKVVDGVMVLQRMGWVGVDLFFALSGFLITGILYDSLGDRRYFRNFYARRLFRIAPLYYAAILGVLLAVAAMHALGPLNLKLLGLEALYLQNSAFSLSDAAQASLVFRYTGHLWSLAVEEQFYLVWPLLIYLVRGRVRLMWLSLGLAALAPVLRIALLNLGYPQPWVYHFTFCRQDSLLVGAWLALAVRGPGREQVTRLAVVPFVLAIGVIGVQVWRRGSLDFLGDQFVMRYGYSVIAIGSAALVAMSLRGGSVVQRVLSLRFFRWFGKYSYGIYVLHVLVYRSRMGWLDQDSLKGHYHVSPLTHLVSTTLVTAVTLGAAWLSFHYFERPFLRLKRYFNYDRLRNPASTATS